MRNFGEDMYKAYLRTLLNLTHEIGDGESVIIQPSIQYVENIGFRKSFGGIYTYKQKKCGLSTLYTKSRLCNKGIFCFPNYPELVIEFDDPGSTWPNIEDITRFNLP